MCKLQCCRLFKKNTCCLLMQMVAPLLLLFLIRFFNLILFLSDAFMTIFLGCCCFRSPGAGATVPMREQVNGPDPQVPLGTSVMQTDTVSIRTKKKPCFFRRPSKDERARRQEEKKEIRLSRPPAIHRVAFHHVHV